jgi:16S rRNA (guanine(1405)-N(7))-methyltransferase
MKGNIGPTGDPIEQYVSKVRENPKYASIHEALIRRIACQEVAKRKDPRQVVKAIKNKLHQVGGAYLDRPVNYTHSLEELTSAFHQGQDQFRQACQQVMCYHSSTRERLPEIDHFYRTLIPELPPLRRVIDVACGLNPLAIPWMGLPADVEYIAIDIFGDMVSFLNQFFSLIGIQGYAIVGDVIGEYPAIQADVGFVLKTIPCLEQVDKYAGIKLLDELQTEYIIVSFPVHSLGGRRDKGMIENYTNRFTEITNSRQWTVKRYEFTTELVFIVRK